MRIIIVNVLFLILYVSTGILLELLGFKSPPLFAFVYFTLGAIVVSANFYMRDVLNLKQDN